MSALFFVGSNVGIKISPYDIQMNVYMSLYLALLFVVLTPGVLLSLPPGGSKLVVAATHGVVFAIVYYVTHKAVWNATRNM
jgi:amino acid permease